MSGRYNSADGWLRGTVWVARTEHLAALCDGIAPIALADPRSPAAAIDLVLGDRRTPASACGRRASTSSRRTRRRGRASPTPSTTYAATAPAPAAARAAAVAETAAPGALALDRAGRLLAESFLPEPISPALGAALARAEARAQALRLGIACPKELAAAAVGGAARPARPARWRCTRS